MNDNELSQLLKNTSPISDVTRDQHIATALQNFDASQQTTSSRRRSRTSMWSVAAAALFVVGAGVGVTVANVTDDDTPMYAEANIDALGAMTTDQDVSNNDNGSAPVKGAPPAIGPCDTQLANSDNPELNDAKFITIVRINDELVALYAQSTTTEPVVILVDPNSCSEFVITQG